MKKLVLFFLLVSPGFGLYAQEATPATFANPLLPSGADPFSFYKDGFYYYTHTTGNRLELWKTKSLAELGSAERKTIFTPPAGTPYSKDVWAPEVHFINGNWYAYFAADDGDNNRHRIYVLQNASADPMQGEWTFKGKVADPSDKWAIDGNVYRYKKKWYMVWSGWEGDTNGRQDIYIARMKNPWTLEGHRVRISSPTLDWEKHGDLHDPVHPPHVDVNEGPQFLEHQGKLFVVYSASGCWTDFYALGLLTFTGKDDLLEASQWKKSEHPLFQQSPENGVFAPGHNSFFTSPDGKESWILYHANDQPGQGCGRFRSPRMQKFCWNADGTPSFGQPVKTGTPITLPSGITPAAP
ncbi:glycoside hydrolase family 43 protein [Paraflavisolibacter sp. H34]|uniref:glycoside hydrolase family 43 protein n=1 Tax=Huijunlia imazamoxiresistens TaxID=3127457 RepID=UPI0030188A95